MATATEPRIHDPEAPAAETDAERAEREAAERKAKADRQLHARLLDLLPSHHDIPIETVAAWDDDEREAVTLLITEPPAELADIPEHVIGLFPEGVTWLLAYAAQRRRLENALRRDDRVRKAERRLVKEQRTLKEIDDDLDDLKGQRKSQEAKVQAAVHVLQEAVKDQSNGQNTLPGTTPEEPADEPRPSPPADPAATAPVSDLEELTETEVANLVDAGIHRMSDLIAWADDERRRKVKGFGKAKLELLGAALNRWREANPVAEGE